MQKNMTRVFHGTDFALWCWRWSPPNLHKASNSLLDTLGSTSRQQCHSELVSCKWNLFNATETLSFELFMYLELPLLIVSVHQRNIWFHKVHQITGVPFWVANYSLYQGLVKSWSIWQPLNQSNKMHSRGIFHYNIRNMFSSYTLGRL
jgi:hypothetical protein